MRPSKVIYDRSRFKPLHCADVKDFDFDAIFKDANGFTGQVLHQPLVKKQQN
jgi:hypothetical protein